MNDHATTQHDLEHDLEPEFEVEHILDKRIFHRQPQYLVKWKGYPLYDATWEPITNLGNCKDLIQAFDEKGEIDLNRGECKGLDVDYINRGGTGHVERDLTNERIESGDYKPYDLCCECRHVAGFDGSESHSNREG